MTPIHDDRTANLPARVGGIVLCGGHSERMRRPKAWLPIGDEVFLQRVVRLLAEAVSPVVVVGAAGQCLPSLPESVLVARDSQPDRGPLQGLLAGLDCLAERVDAVYLTSCDAPMLHPAFVRRMIGLLGDYDIVVPESDGWPHPLAGVYRVRVRESAQRLLAADSLRLTGLLTECRTLLVLSDNLRDADPDLRTLWNVNTPDEYDELLRDLAAKHCPTDRHP